MTGFLSDIRHAIRGFRREPGFTAIALLVLALGIGANTAIFSAVRGVLLEPLPFVDPDRIMVVWERNLPRNRLTNVGSPANFFRWQEQNAVFDQLAAVSLPTRVSLTGGGDPEDIQVQLVSGPLFSLLGVRPSVGRLWLPDEDRPGNDKVLISHRLWRRRFNSHSSIVGRTIALRAEPKVVVGVLPPAFSLLERGTDAWLPAGFGAGARTFTGRFLTVFGRLNPGLPADRAHAEMQVLGNRLAAEYPESNAGWTIKLERVATSPGVVDAGAISVLPLDGRIAGNATSVRVIGRPEPPPDQGPSADVRLVSGDYFRVLGVRLLRGRFFSERDFEPDARVVIINETMARELWPGEDPIGRRVYIAMGQEGDDEIVGVVSDLHQTSLDVAPRAITYWPHTRLAFPGMSLAVRTTGDPTSIARAIFGQVRALDPEQPISDIRTLDEVVTESISQRRIVAIVIGGFALLALVLALAGVYGVIAYLVTQRSPEIGVRLALGAQRYQVLALVLSEALKLTAVGLSVGIMASLPLTRLLQPLLFDVEPRDPSTYVGVTILFSLTAAVAAMVPGLRVTRIDPASTLHAE